VGYRLEIDRMTQRIEEIQAALNAKNKVTTKRPDTSNVAPEAQAVDAALRNGRKK